MGKTIVVIVIFVVLIVAAILVYNQLSPTSQDEYEVERVIDGDTIELSSGDRVRLIGINTPESGQPYYGEATAKLKELLGDSKVTLKTDKEDKDQYDRLLRYVYVNDTHVNMEMVRLGMATAYEFEPNVKYSSEFADAEAEARHNSFGIWTPSQYSITISHFNYDAEGNDNNNLNDEYVIFENPSNSSVDMTGWLILDQSNNEYWFPAFVLSNSSAVTFYTGSGTDSATELYWDLTKSVWNNGGDTLYLRDSEGFLVNFQSY
jgi:micrococcal nuclease